MSPSLSLSLWVCACMHLYLHMPVTGRETEKSRETERALTQSPWICLCDYVIYSTCSVCRPGFTVYSCIIAETAFYSPKLFMKCLSTIHI